MEEIKNFISKYIGAIIGVIVAIIVLCTGLHNLILGVVLLAIGAFVGNYIQQNKDEVKIDYKSHSVFSSTRSMPDGCLSDDFPECYSRNYLEVELKAENTCVCNVVFDGKQFTENFDMNIQIEYKELIGMKNFNESKFHENLFHTYCNFVCNAFNEQIKNGTYVESK